MINKAGLKRVNGNFLSCESCAGSFLCHEREVSLHWRSCLLRAHWSTLQKPRDQGWFPLDCSQVRVPGMILRAATKSAAAQAAVSVCCARKTSSCVLAVV